MTLQGVVTPIGAISRAATAVKCRVVRVRYFLGPVSVKRRGQVYVHAQLVTGRRGAGKNSPQVLKICTTNDFFLRNELLLMAVSQWFL